ncbi:hypothetical protein BDK51DRAFT_42558 [Blyttiomyces helicus]|uniref:Uncharacterized protein n=1 Tax=Blyttiomyces helicus TaxID=388810 RepID=A0A4P9W4R1_9FUNG|nr:hypothetical protein BDK51DRAFT_42558 [Blyttiomyces helicus]|eukprot:RKO86902.1 hypothetical protein BDK51DRAFT_42558 [Blyttiomyces helicus]
MTPPAACPASPPQSVAIASPKALSTSSFTFLGTRDTEATQEHNNGFGFDSCTIIVPNMPTLLTHAHTTGAYSPQQHHFLATLRAAGRTAPKSCPPPPVAMIPPPRKAATRSSSQTVLPEARQRKGFGVQLVVTLAEQVSPGKIPWQCACLPAPYHNQDPSNPSNPPAVAIFAVMEPLSQMPSPNTSVWLTLRLYASFPLILSTYLRLSDQRHNLPWHQGQLALALAGPNPPTRTAFARGWLSASPPLRRRRTGLIYATFKSAAEPASWSTTVPTNICAFTFFFWSLTYRIIMAFGAPDPLPPLDVVQAIFAGAILAAIEIDMIEATRAEKELIRSSK